jgi:hypothetical protein
MHSRRGIRNRGLAVLDLITYGHGYGDGYGYGSGSGSGDGSGSGSGSGYGYGSGSGSGDGSGSGSGSGDGSGYGYGYGYGYGFGYVMGIVNDYEIIKCDPFPYLKIGCEIHTIDWWLSNWEATSKQHEITVDHATVEKIKRRIT